MNRRFFVISALALALPSRAPQMQLWQGGGLGGAVSLRLQGSPAQLALLVPRIKAELAHVAAIASLQAESELVRLNRLGRLSWP